MNTYYTVYNDTEERRFSCPIILQRNLCDSIFQAMLYPSQNVDPSGRQTKASVLHGPKDLRIVLRYISFYGLKSLHSPHFRRCEIYRRLRLTNYKSKYDSQAFVARIYITTIMLETGTSL